MVFGHHRPSPSEATESCVIYGFQSLLMHLSESSMRLSNDPAYSFGLTLK